MSCIDKEKAKIKRNVKQKKQTKRQAKKSNANDKNGIKNIDFCNDMC